MIYVSADGVTRTSRRAYKVLCWGLPVLIVGLLKSAAFGLTLDVSQFLWGALMLLAVVTAAIVVSLGFADIDRRAATLGIKWLGDQYEEARMRLYLLWFAPGTVVLSMIIVGLVSPTGPAYWAGVAVSVCALLIAASVLYLRRFSDLSYKGWQIQRTDTAS